MSQPGTPRGPQIFKTMSLTYTVKTSYFSWVPDVEGNMTEKPTEADVEILHLQRTNPAHMAVALKLLEGYEHLDQLGTLSVEFCKCVIKDDKLRESIVKDMGCCLDIFQSEAVAEDIENFLSGLGFVQKMIRKAENLSRKEKSTK